MDKKMDIDEIKTIEAMEAYLNEGQVHYDKKRGVYEEEPHEFHQKAYCKEVYGDARGAFKEGRSHFINYRCTYHGAHHNNRNPNRSGNYNSGKGSCHCGKETCKGRRHSYDNNKRGTNSINREAYKGSSDHSNKGDAYNHRRESYKVRRGAYNDSRDSYRGDRAAYDEGVKSRRHDNKGRCDSYHNERDSYSGRRGSHRKRKGTHDDAYGKERYNHHDGRNSYKRERYNYNDQRGVYNDPNDREYKFKDERERFQNHLRRCKNDVGTLSYETRRGDFMIERKPQHHIKRNVYQGNNGSYADNLYSDDESVYNKEELLYKDQSIPLTEKEGRYRFGGNSFEEDNAFHQNEFEINPRAEELFFNQEDDYQTLNENTRGSESTNISPFLKSSSIASKSTHISPFLKSSSIVSKSTNISPFLKSSSMVFKSTRRLKVCNLPPNYEIRDFKNLFFRFGVIDEINWNSQGFGTITFNQIDDAEMAKNTLDGQVIDGYKIKVTHVDSNLNFCGVRNLYGLHIDPKLRCAKDDFSKLNSGIESSMLNDSSNLMGSSSNSRCMSQKGSSAFQLAMYKNENNSKNMDLFSMKNKCSCKSKSKQCNKPPHYVCYSICCPHSMKSSRKNSYLHCKSLKKDASSDRNIC